MAYGNRTRASAANATVRSALGRTSRTWGGYQAWRLLDPDRRFELIEEALSPANDRDGARQIAL